MNEQQEQKILNFLQEHEYASIETLAENFSVSESTIRRKLNKLQKSGLITRTHGGAQINNENNFFPSFTFRTHQNSFEKKKIALSAIKLIKNGDLIFLDGTTSAFFIAEYLSEFDNIKVITNGIDTLSLLSKYNVSAYSTGGYISTTNRSVLVGRYAAEMIKNFHADIAFFSAQSVDNNGQIYDCFEEENFIRKTMLERASKKVFLCDSTKFGKTSPFHLCSLNEIDFIISNHDLPDAIKTDNTPQIITD